MVTLDPKAGVYWFQGRRPNIMMVLLNNTAFSATVTVSASTNLGSSGQSCRVASKLRPVKGARSKPSSSPVSY